MTETMQTRIAHALQGVVNPRTSEDVIRSGMIRDVAVSVEGRVRFTILLDAQDPASLVREVRQAAERVDGVQDVRVDVRDPSQSSANSAVPPVSRGPAAPPPAFSPPKGRSLPVMGQEPKAKAVPPAPTPVAYPNLGRILAISSGKGGVGKSTVTVNLAVAMARQGLRVGLMDADVYGPNIPMMMGVNSPPPVVGDRIQPLVRARRHADESRLPHRARPARDLARPDRDEDRHAVPARRELGNARLSARRHAAGHRRRAALARAGDARPRRDHRDDAAAGVHRRRAARREDVRARERPRARHRREHELPALRALRQAHAAIRQRRRTRARRRAERAAARRDPARDGRARRRRHAAAR